MNRTAIFIERAAILLFSLGFSLLANISGPYREKSPVYASPSGARSTLMPFVATANFMNGNRVRHGEPSENILTADPNILPWGSRIRIYGAGHYSGIYTVYNTGRKVKGHRIDLHLVNAKDAQRFGKRRVMVEVLRRGDERPSAPAGAVVPARRAVVTP